jgi:purine-binding chemotaxis protein CheW
MDDVQLIAFSLRGNLYGIDIRVVKEINPLTSITPVPKARRHIRGLVNIRGEVVLVMDLPVIFGGDSYGPPPGAQIVILKTAAELKRVRSASESFIDIELGDKPVGFIVDHVVDVVHVEEDAIEPVPPHLAPSMARCFDGAVRAQEGVQMILNAGQILTGGAVGDGS